MERCNELRVVRLASKCGWFSSFFLPEVSPDTDWQKGGPFLYVPAPDAACNTGAVIYAGDARMNTKASASNSRALLVTIACGFSTLSGLPAVKAGIVPASLALAIATSCTGLVRRRERLHFKHRVAILPVFTVFAVLVGAAWTNVGTLLLNFTKQIPAFCVPLCDWLIALREIFAEHCWKIPKDGMNVVLVADVVFWVACGFFRGTDRGLITLLVLVAIAAFWGLSVFRSGNAKRSGLREPETETDQLHNVALGVNRGLVMGTAMGMILVALSLILPLGCEMPKLSLWALLLIALKCIPIFGMFLVFSPPILITLIGKNSEFAEILKATCLVITTIVLYLFKPALIVRRLKLLRALIIVSLVFWGWLFGPAGMVLAVPIAMAMQINFGYGCGYHLRRAPLNADASAKANAGVMITREPCMASRAWQVNVGAMCSR